MPLAYSASPLGRHAKIIRINWKKPWRNHCGGSADPPPTGHGIPAEREPGYQSVSLMILLVREILLGVVFIGGGSFVLADKMSKKWIVNCSLELGCRVIEHDVLNLFYCSWNIFYLMSRMFYRAKKKLFLWPC